MNAAIQILKSFLVIIGILCFLGLMSGICSGCKTTRSVTTTKERTVKAIDSFAKDVKAILATKDSFSSFRTEKDTAIALPEQRATLHLTAEDLAPLTLVITRLIRDSINRSYYEDSMYMESTRLASYRDTNSTTLTEIVAKEQSGFWGKVLKVFFEFMSVIGILLSIILIVLFLLYRYGRL